MLRILSIVCLTTLLGLSGYGQINVSGFVVDAATGESLPGANVYQGTTGTVSNNYGFFSLNLPDTARCFWVSFVGYQSQRVGFSGSDKKSFRVALLRGELLKEVVVSAGRTSGERSAPAVEITKQRIVRIPTLLGEPDIFKSLQMYPGINFGAEGTVDLHVRGGDRDQNLVLLDDVILYHTSHTGGLFSSINSELVKKVKVYTGGFPARYSGRVASVLDIRTRDGSTLRTNVGGTISPLLATLFFETPVQRNRSALLVSVRRSMFDLALAHLDGVPPYRFFDTNLKYHHQLGASNHLYFNFYHSNDGMERGVNSTVFQQTEKLDYGNTVGSLRWNHVFGERLFMNNSLAFSHYNFYYGNSTESTDSKNAYAAENAFQTLTQELRLRTDFELRPNTMHLLRFGWSVANMRFVPENAFMATDFVHAVERADTVFSRQHTFETSVYLEDQIRLSFLELEPGVNLINYFTGHNSYTFIEPRLGLATQLGRGFTITGSYSRMSQNVHLLTHTGPLLPEDIWFPSTDSIPPVSAHQAGAGMVGRFRGWTLSMEGYYKWLDKLTEKRWDASGKSPLSLIEIGRGRAYGLETMLQYQNPWLEFMASYTYSRTLRTFQHINFGREFRGTYDRPNDLKVLLSLKLNKRLSLSANFNYKSGHLTNIQTARFSNALSYISLPMYRPGLMPNVDYYDERNGFRLPEYLRLDLDLSFQFGKKLGSQLRIGAYNVTNHHNAVSVTASSLGVYSTSLWGFFPYISYGWRLHP